MLRVIVLGAAAGGGFPQWNCACDNCRAAIAHDVAAQTQSSLAVSGDGEQWFLLNASPDLRQQIIQTPALHPRPADGGLRHSPIVGAVLTNADVDHVAGLLTLRESQPLAVYGTARVLGVLAANSIFNVLNPAFVERRTMALDAPQELRLRDGTPSGLLVEAFSVPGKIALWLEDPSLANFGSVAEDTIGLRISDTEGRSLFYVPGCAAMTPDLAERLRGAEAVFFDGTTFTDDEMIAVGMGAKTAARMGHMAMSGPDGSMEALAPLGIGRRFYIHINNSNPALVPGSPQRATVEAAGWQVAHDGLEITL
ncbi:MAG: pyrroloquinoline quinone biosynthesis protein PqqB [Rhodospirillaceae bacterium BRH_c57]|nr:MAG: pyrroloquinoline quinone biosynthesis protein PqqB [Rhodospirillaceae bacterium BRH_c57]